MILNVGGFLCFSDEDGFQARMRCSEVFWFERQSMSKVAFFSGWQIRQVSGCQGRLCEDGKTSLESWVFKAE